MAPKRNGRKAATKSQPKRPTTKTSPPQASSETGPQSPGRVVFAAHGADLERDKEAAPRKKTCAKLNLRWTTGNPPTNAKNATTLVERRLAEYYNNKEQQEKERKECEKRGLSIEGDGLTLRKRRFEAESIENEVQGSGKRPRGNNELSEGFTREETLSFLKRRKLDEEGTDCELRLRLVESELDFLQKNCKKEWDSLFFGYKNVKDLQQEAQRKHNAKKSPVNVKSIEDIEWEIIYENTLDISANADNWTGHFTQQNVKGDGNCLFRAFAAVYWGKENQHSKVRRDAQELWKAVSQGGLAEPAPAYRRHVYDRLDEQSYEAGPQTKYNAPLATQIANNRYWASQEMLQLLADVYDVTIIVHFPLFDTQGVQMGWNQTVRGSNEGRKQLHVHLAYYGSAYHYTALHPIQERGRHFPRFTMHEQNPNLKRIYIDNVDGDPDLPTDLLYDPPDPIHVKEPHWSKTYPEDDEDEGGDDNSGDEDGKRDDNNNSSRGNSGKDSSDNNNHNAHGKRGSNGDRTRGRAGPSVQRQRRRASSLPSGGQKAPLNVAANTLPDPFNLHRRSTNAKSARRVGGLFSSTANQNRAAQFNHQSPYDARFSAPNSRLPPRSPISALDYLRSPTELRLERKAIRDANRIPDYRSGMPDFGRPVGVQSMPFGMYGDWEEYEPGHKFYPRVAPDHREDAPRYDDYGRVARRRQERTSPQPPPYSIISRPQSSPRPRSVAATPRPSHSPPKRSPRAA